MKEDGGKWQLGGDKRQKIQFDCNLMYTFYCLRAKLDSGFVFRSPFAALQRQNYREKKLLRSCLTDAAAGKSS